MKNDDDFKLLRGFADRQTNEQTDGRTDICDCRVAFTTEKSCFPCLVLLLIILKKHKGIHTLVLSKRKWEDGIQRLLITKCHQNMESHQNVL